MFILDVNIANPRERDEFQYQGEKARSLKKSVSPTLNESATSKEAPFIKEKSDYPKVKLINYEISKKK